MPGQYTVELDANGQHLTQCVSVMEDPRIATSADDLKASFALSQKIAPVLADAAAAYREKSALGKLLEKRFPKPPADAAVADALAKLRAKPVPGAPTFQSVGTALAEVEGALEFADVAPTPVQNRVVDDQIAKLAALRSDWAAEQAGPLAALNAALAKSGQPPVTITDAEKLAVEPPDEGQDLP